MADIKFMDLSQNDDPATTDSILVGNQDNGLKRTTLGKIGDMFAVHGLFKFEQVSSLVNVDSGHLSINITAPAVDGYTFAFWLNSSSVKWVGPTYIESPNSQTTNIWVCPTQENNDLNALSNGSNSVTATAVYVKNSIAQ